ncbi:MAG: 6,7-dimethyl-8-ribityllumazine synthase [Chloroflexi bacterium]|nr:6,7-dimethyl-8-ribityllumazine synthase [Chloroflexota bacterium]|tara:strand:- start:2694 stop:3158 length:465 start_codon:yes stop_codon:yes gene_type:complete
MPKFYEGDLDGSFFRLAIIVSRFTEDITERLLEGALTKAKEAGVSDSSISVFYCPGAFEIPLVAEALASSYSYDAVICLGCVIRGETSHFDYVAGECARGIADVSRLYRVPVTLGVITAENRSQAEARAGGSKTNMGSDAMEAAIRMASLFEGF